MYNYFSGEEKSEYIQAREKLLSELRLLLPPGGITIFRKEKPFHHIRVEMA